jgi:N-acetylglucosaminyl-diphospho-decaprenol L-rhamnosyltransferase
MALRREAYAEVGGLDSSRFLFGEEMDWSWRARRLNWRTVFLPSPVVVHHGGASGESMLGERFVLVVESRVEFLRRYRGAWRAAIAREVLVLGAALRWCASRLRLWLAGPGATRERDRVASFGAVLRWRFQERP